MYFKSKKGLYQGLYLASVATIIMFLTASISLYYSSTFSNSIEESAPQISYEFPKVLVNTFLMQPVLKEDSKKIFGDESNYLVRDLIWYGSEESLKMADEYSDEYILEIESKSNGEALDLYGDFSNNYPSKISIKERSDSLLRKQEVLERYTFLILTKDEEYIEVSFGEN